MSAKAGFRKFGDVARNALKKEFKQLVDKPTFTPIDPNTLSKEERKEALECINIIAQKRCGLVKGRTCADGRKQQGKYDKSETASPTVSSDALMLTVVVDAKEGRCVGTADVTGAYLNAMMDELVIMALRGEFALLMCEVEPSYRQFLTYENGVPTLYLRLDRALYGCVKSALLWYNLFAETLVELGFKINPYDACVANAIINNKQCTIAWYVDDMKISHMEQAVVDDIIEKIEDKFGKMKVTRGKVHNFLGMEIDYSTTGIAKIGMSGYLQEAIDDFILDVDRTVATPASRTLFEINKESPQLTKERKDIFHSVTAKLLYVSLRGRPDLLLAICFLATRVTAPTIEDQDKLKRVLRYIKGTMDETMSIGADDLEHLTTWVDASFAVHDNMRSHTGGVISFGTGGLMAKSSKQKLNTKSSTEAELVGASDYLPNTIWAMNFMEAQGYPIKFSHFEQDNESAIRLEKNGRMSAGQKSRHINIRHFWIKDRLKSEKINIRHCPTEQMLSDFLTKPLQGNLFRRFRDVLLGKDHISTLSQISSTDEAMAEERVEDQPKETPVKFRSGNGAEMNTGRSIPLTKKTPTWSEIVQNGTTSRGSCSHSIRIIPP